jgi:hypothetical protein
MNFCFWHKADMELFFFRSGSSSDLGFSSRSFHCLPVELTIALGDGRF